MGNMHWRLHGTKPIETGRCAFRVRNGEMRLVDTWFGRDELILPEEVGGRPLTAIGEEAFCSTRLRRIVLPSTVRSIGRRAFAKRWHLACVVIPESVTAIDETAFEEAEDVCLCVREGSCAHRFAREMGLPFAFEEPPLEIFPEDNLVIGDYLCCLQEDGSLTIREYNGGAERLTVPAELAGRSVKRIGWGAFRRCRSLVEVEVARGVEELGPLAFERCTRLRRISLPADMWVVGAGCFRYCTALEEVRLPQELGEIPFMCFDMCRSLRGIELPAKLRQIGRYAFNRCTQLEEAAMPDTVETINLLSFGRCSALKRISMPRGLRYVGPGAFLDCSSLHVPEIPEGAEVDEQAFAGCPGLPEAADDDWM